MSTDTPITVRVSRDYAVPSERVFDAWLDPDSLARWMVGRDVRDEEVVHVQVDPRVGGAFSFLVRRDGQDVDHVGTYLEIDRPRRLVFTWHVPPDVDALSRVTIVVAPRVDGCTLTLTHEIDPRYAAYAARTEQGWTTILEALERAMHADAFGVAIEPGVVRFERLLPGPVERVWTYLTDSEARGLWLATGEMEPRVGGRVTLHFHHKDLSSIPEPTPERWRAIEDGVTSTGRVTRWEPPHVLAFTWSDEAEPSEVVFELTPHADGTRLVLTHRKLASRADMLDVSGGWHIHLGVLVARLQGRPPGGFWSAHQRIDGLYDRRLPPA
jgi:uncharacterized protein YndB with AHSA1/START domain